jgi:hypothetical protein
MKRYSIIFRNPCDPLFERNSIIKIHKYHVDESIQFFSIRNDRIAVMFLDFLTPFDENLLTGSIPLSTVSRNVVIFIELFLCY